MMNNQAGQIAADHGALFDEFIDNFERARQAGSVADVAEFFPGQKVKSYWAIALELLRVDIQYGWKYGSPTPLPEYLRRFPDILEDLSSVSELAFEEFRTRRLLGQSVDQAEYSRLYGVDTSSWPIVSESTVAARSTQQSTVVPGGRKHDLASVHVFASGDKFGEFQLLHELGRGAFARVFLAQQPELAHRRVILKLTTNLSVVEPQLLAKLQHANIVPVYSIHDCQGTLGVCMPDFGPCTLHDVSKSFHHLDPPTAECRLPPSGAEIVELLHARREKVTREIGEENADDESEPLSHFAEMSYVNACVHLMLDVANGLRHAHDKGIVHCDLKPANILIADHGVAMLLDFNLSGEIDTEHSKRSLVGGTLPYLAPEHLTAIASGESIMPSADIFSFGAILYELLTGKLPFGMAGSSLSPDITKIAERRNTSPTLASELNPRVPVGLANVVHRLLSASPGERYQSMQHVCEDLSRHLDQRPFKHVENPVGERFANWRRRHPTLTSATAVGSLAVVMLLALASLLVVRTNHVRQVQTAYDLQRAQDNLRRVRVLSSIPDTDPVLLQEAIQLSDQSIAPFVVSPPNVDELRLQIKSPVYAREVQQCLSEHLYLNAKAIRQLDARRADGKREVVRARQLDDLAGMMSQSLGEITDDSIAAVIRQIDENGAASVVAKLEALLHDHQYDMSVWLLLGNAYANAGRLREADGCYSTCCVMWPESAVARLQRGACRSTMELYSEAEQDFSEVLRLRPNLVSALVNRASVRGKMQRYSEAIDDLDRAEKLQGTPTRVYFMRAEFLKSIGEVERAERAFQKGLELKPADANSWVWRGLAHLERESHDQAMADFEAALLVSPHSRDAMLNIAYILAEVRKDNESAIPLMDQVVERFQHFEDIAGRGVLLARIGEFDAAIADAEKAISSERRKPETVYRAACVFSFASRRAPGHAERAIELIDVAIRLKPSLAIIAMKDPDLADIKTNFEFKLAVREGIRILRAQQELDGNAE